MMSKNLVKGQTPDSRFRGNDRQWLYVLSDQRNPPAHGFIRGKKILQGRFLNRFNGFLNRSEVD